MMMLQMSALGVRLLYVSRIYDTLAIWKIRFSALVVVVLGCPARVLMGNRDGFSKDTKPGVYGRCGTVPIGCPVLQGSMSVLVSVLAIVVGVSRSQWSGFRKGVLKGAFGCPSA